MKEYTVVWHYIANYSIFTGQFESPEDAVKKVTFGFSEEFFQKANVYVFAGRPVHKSLKGK